MIEVNLDQAEYSQWPEILALTRSSYEQYAATSDPVFWSIYQKSVEQTLLCDQSVMRIVAKSGDEIVGAVLYCPPHEKLMGHTLVKNPFPEMRLLAVPSAQRNRGIAAKLIAYCEEKAKSDGFETVTLHTTVLMQVAKQMYEKRGYIKYPEIDFEPVPGFIVWGYRKDFA